LDLEDISQPFRQIGPEKDLKVFFSRHEDQWFPHDLDDVVAGQKEQDIEKKDEGCDRLSGSDVAKDLEESFGETLLFT
jgi:hypothetical protein